MNLKQLAESLGLSQTTVSRALNDYPEVGETTRLRVKAAARAANYQPNSRARRLATGRAMTIGHVLPMSLKGELVNPVFSDFVAGASEVYSREGYDILLSLVPVGGEEKAYRTFVTNGSVDGMLVHAPHIGDPRIELLQRIRMPFVVHGRTDKPEGYSWLDIANARAFRRATDFLLDLGHRRIGLINGQQSFDFALRRARGYSEALTARGLSVDPAYMTWGAMTESHGYRSAADMFDSAAPPTAFLASSMISAIGIRRALGERGLRLGRDISLVTHDDVLSYMKNDGDGPNFTATRSSIREAGRQCAEMLIDQIRNPGQPPVQHLWDVDLTVGRSTGPAPTKRTAS